MKRRLLNVLTLLSLLLCVAVVALWVRSYWVSDGYEFVRKGVRWEAVSEKGTLWLSDLPQKRIDPSHPSRMAKARLKPEHYDMPHALAVASLAVAPAVWLTLAASARSRHRRRVDQNLCPRCAYDLRATPDRCPECGAAAGVTRGG